MKHLLLALSICTSIFLCNAQEIKYIDALELNLVNKLASPTTNPYHRVEVKDYKLNKSEAKLLKYPSGMAVVFKTNSTKIAVKGKYIYYNSSRGSTTMVSQAGYDLYIRKDGEWLYAASNCPEKEDSELVLVANMDNSEKECLLYLPLFSEMSQVEVGIDAEANIAPIDNPFKHKIIIFGSSYTQGTSTGRPGMSYPMILQRRTGWGFCSLGMAGRSMLQPAMAKVIADNECDAIIIDAFSNPKADIIRERFATFVEIVRASHPDTPIIFLQTIYRERANFDLKLRATEEAKRQAAKEVCKEAMKTDKNIYFIDVPNQTGTDHITSLDGTHPDDLGYWRWANAIEPQIRKILKKYGIK